MSDFLTIVLGVAVGLPLAVVCLALAILLTSQAVRRPWFGFLFASVVLIVALAVTP